MLKLEQVNKTFYPNTGNEKRAMDHLDLLIHTGEFVTVIGSNGAGKSTLFNLIAGSILPDSGRILLDNEDITFLPEHKRASRIGRIFQDPMRGTAPSMTVEENLALSYLRGKKHRFGFGISKKEREFFRQQLSQLELGLEDRMQTPIGMLSGGQRQAVSLLMCTMVTPKLLLLDEHTAALDPATAEKVLSITKRIVEENHITTLMITHNIRSALELGNRTIMMDDGRILLDFCGAEREKMTVSDLMERFSKACSKQIDNDRMLLEHQSR